MKKVILSIVAVCAMAITGASAQEFSWGVKAGMNVSTVGGDLEADARIGYAAGLMSEYKFSDKSAAGVELLYSSQGFKVGEAGYDLSHINIPILYNFYIGDAFAIKAGIQPGFMVGAKGRYDGESVDVDKDLFNSFALAIPVGVSYTFGEKIVLDARYNIACTNLVDGDDYSSSKNHVFQLSVGYKF